MEMNKKESISFSERFRHFLLRKLEDLVLEHTVSIIHYKGLQLHQTYFDLKCFMTGLWH